MKTRELERYRQQLMELRDRLLGDVTTVSETARQASGGQGESDLSNALDLADRGTDQFVHALNAALLENEEQLTADVREALSRIEDGTFGVCDNCNQAIAQERLQAMPFARHCVVCAEAIDHANPQLTAGNGTAIRGAPANNRPR